MTQEALDLELKEYYITGNWNQVSLFLERNPDYEFSSQTLFEILKAALIPKDNTNLCSRLSHTGLADFLTIEKLLKKVNNNLTQENASTLLIELTKYRFFGSFANTDWTNLKNLCSLDARDQFSEEAMNIALKRAYEQNKDELINFICTKTNSKFNADFILSDIFREYEDNWNLKPASKWNTLKFLCTLNKNRPSAEAMTKALDMYVKEINLEMVNSLVQATDSHLSTDSVNSQILTIKPWQNTTSEALRKKRCDLLLVLACSHHKLNLEAVKALLQAAVLSQVEDFFARIIELPQFELTKQERWKLIQEYFDAAPKDQISPTFLQFIKAYAIGSGVQEIVSFDPDARARAEALRLEQEQQQRAEALRKQQEAQQQRDEALRKQQEEEQQREEALSVQQQEQANREKEQTQSQQTIESQSRETELGNEPQTHTVHSQEPSTVLPLNNHTPSSQLPAATTPVVTSPTLSAATANPLESTASLTRSENQNTTRNSSKKTISLMVLSGFITALGLTALALAFTVLNAATLGIAGLVIAALGAASILTGVGLFATTAYKNKQAAQEEVLTSALTLNG